MMKSRVLTRSKSENDRGSLVPSADSIGRTVHNPHTMAETVLEGDQGRKDPAISQAPRDSYVVGSRFVPTL